MTLLELQDYVLFQTNNDTDDLGDFTPYINGYINEGYDRLVEAYAGAHVGDEGYPKLSAVEMTPNLPDWMQLGIAYWATWLIYRNGNPNKQQRGAQFRASAEEIKAKVLSSGGINGKADTFHNIPLHPYSSSQTNEPGYPYK